MSILIRARSSLLVVLATALLLSACGGSVNPHQVSAPRGSATTMTFTVATGITSLTIRSGAIPGSLYQVDTPDAAGIRPTVTNTGSDLNLQFIGLGYSGPSVATVILSNSLRWHLRLDGGSTDANIDLTRGGFGSIDLSSGVTAATINLPSPSGRQTVSEEGGASSFHISVPRTTPTFVRFSGGAGSVVINGSRYSGIAGGRTFQAAGWNAAHNRLEIDLDGGVSHFLLTSR